MLCNDDNDDAYWADCCCRIQASLFHLLAWTRRTANPPRITKTIAFVGYRGRRRLQTRRAGRPTRARPSIDCPKILLRIGARPQTGTKPIRRLIDERASHAHAHRAKRIQKCATRLIRGKAAPIRNREYFSACGVSAASTAVPSTRAFLKKMVELYFWAWTLENLTLCQRPCLFILELSSEQVWISQITISLDQDISSISDSISTFRALLYTKYLNEDAGVKSEDAISVGIGGWVVASDFNVFLTVVWVVLISFRSLISCVWNDLCSSISKACVGVTHRGSTG